MVVNKTPEDDLPVDPRDLDLGYLGLFLGLRINELVAESLSSAGFQNVRQSHGYVIQHLIGGNRTITDLAGRMGVTQQAASKVVGEMVDLGILEAVGAPDRRAKHIRLSDRGWQSVKLARKTRQRVESRLMARVGDSYAAAKATLVDCLAELGGLEQIRSRRIREPR